MNPRDYNPSLGEPHSNRNFNISPERYVSTTVMAASEPYCDAAIRTPKDQTDGDVHRTLRTGVDRETPSAFISTKSPSGGSQQHVFQSNSSKSLSIQGADGSIAGLQMDSVHFDNQQRADRDNIINQSRFLDCGQSGFLNNNSSESRSNEQTNSVVRQSSFNPLSSRINSTTSHVSRGRLYHSENDITRSAFNQSGNSVEVGDSTHHGLGQTEQYGPNSQQQTRKEVESMPSNNSNDTNIGIMHDIESMAFSQQNSHLVSPDNLSILCKTDSNQDPAVYKCTNCRVTFPSQNSFISHLTCSIGSRLGAGNCIGGMPAVNTTTPAAKADAIRRTITERYGSVGLGVKEDCEEVSSSTGKLRSKQHQPLPFSHLLSHQCTSCEQSFGSAESLRYHRSFCRPHTAIMSSDHSNMGRNTSEWNLKVDDPEVIDLTRSTSSTPEFKPCLSPQSASDLQRVPCEICGKTYKNKYTLKSHYRVHSEQRPYTCSVCLKRFKEKGVLKSHEKTHSDERPFPCPICFKCFKAKGTLRTHQKQIHPGMI